MENLNQQLIDQIAQQVLDVLQSRPAPSAVVLKEKVITERLLEEKLNGTKKVQFSTSAVVTPSAKDFLNRNKIEVLTGNQEVSLEKTAKTNSDWNLIVGEDSATVQSVSKSLNNQINMETTKAGCSEGAISAANQSIQNGKTTIVLANQAALVACKLNRNSSSNAAVIENEEQFKRIQNQMKINVVCIETFGKTSFWLKNLIHTIIK